jgi:parvulin-like peptidyl-prolyl isomerase
MSLRLHLCSSAIAISCMLPAQQQPPVAPQPGKPAVAPPGATAKPQDPEQRDPKVLTPEERIAQLEREKARLEQEIAFVKERSGKGKMAQMLKEKLAGAAPSLQSIDAGKSPVAATTTNPGAPPAANTKRARLMTAEELGKADAGVVMTVANMPVRKDTIDQLIAYLGSYGPAGNEEQRQLTAVYTVLQTEVAHAAFADSAATAKIEELQAELKKGGDFAELAKKNSQGPNADKGGDVDVTRRSHHGVWIEYFAFTTAPGSVSPVFRSPQGLNLLRVDKLEKGETTDKDIVKAKLITIAYDGDQTKVRQVQQQLSTGQVEITVRDDATMKILPPMFRPLGTQPPVKLPADNKPPAKAPEAPKK